MPSLSEALRDIPLFAELSDRDRSLLAESMHEKSYSAGDEVVVEGKGGVGFFVILDGTARVSVRGADHGTLRGGDYFGEMALVDGDQRSASVTAEADLRCAGITMWNFRPFIRDHPDIAWALLTARVKRVRAAAGRAAPAG
jgi:CRP/FNR family cyclic AMP-dependent transcriptional regulator